MRNRWEEISEPPKKHNKREIDENERDRTKKERREAKGKTQRRREKERHTHTTYPELRKPERRTREENHGTSLSPPASQ